VNVNTAAAFTPSVGRHPALRFTAQVVGYLGLDPRVRQSGFSEAQHGHISKAGSSEARHMLGEAAWSVAMPTGPMRAFFERIRAPRSQVAATATAAQAVRRSSGTSSPGGGLGLRAAGAHAPEAAAARAARRRAAPARQATRTTRFAGATCTSESARSRPKGSSPIDADRRLAADRKEGCRCDTEAASRGPSVRPARGRAQPAPRPALKLLVRGTQAEPGAIPLRLPSGLGGHRLLQVVSLLSDSPRSGPGRRSRAPSAAVCGCRAGGSARALVGQAGSSMG